MTKLHLNVTDPIINYEIRLAENPIQEIWDDILYFSDPSLLRQSWKFSGVTDDLISYVTTSLKQAYEYYKASQTVTIHTRPLLLYYSALNLTKGILTVVNDRQCEPHHGLSSFTTHDDLSSVFALTRKGAFTELADTLKAQWAKTLGKKISFELLAASCIELFPYYCGAYEKEPKTIGTKISRRTEGIITLTFAQEDMKAISQLQNLLETHPKLNEKFVKDIDASAKGNLIYRNKDPIPEGYNEMKQYGDPLLRELLKFGIRGEIPKIGYLELMSEEDKIPQPVCYLGMLFLLGSAVRYAPISLSKWLHDAAYSRSWILEKFCTLAARIYPNYMVNLLCDRIRKYTPSF